MCVRRYEPPGLEEAAAGYYGSSDLVPVAGPQEAIRELPRIRKQLFGVSRVGVISPGYEEHRYHWQLNGHRVEPLQPEQIEASLDHFDCLVLINPCNPSGARFGSEQLNRWHRKLACRGGWLVVDEAFLDSEPLKSLIKPQMPQGLIVLRSLGKFFGLAGLRVGFLFADKSVREPLLAAIGHWSVATPSRWLAARALRDGAWQRETREQLQSARARLVALLENWLGLPVASTCLFASVQVKGAGELYRQFAANAVLVRYFEQHESLRFGFPGSEPEWERLAQVIAEVKK